MALIKSISGIRGTIGGKVGEGLTPLDVVRYAAAFVYWLKAKSKKEIVGLRDFFDLSIVPQKGNFSLCST